MASRDDRPHLRVSSRTVEAPFFADIRLGTRTATDRREDRIDTREERRADSAANRPDRLIEMRRRVAARYYDRPEIAEQVARRMLERGDL